MHFTVTPKKTLAAAAVAALIVATAMAAFLAGRADSDSGSSPVATQVNGLGKGTKTIKEKLKASPSKKSAASKSKRGPRGPRGARGPAGLQGPAGPVGPAGPQGPSGTANLAAYQGSVYTVAAAGVQSVTLTCPTGMKAAGGGFFTDNELVLLNGSSPTGPTSWEIEVTNLDNVLAGNWRPYAICF
jgi:hypothetical protein